MSILIVAYIVLFSKCFRCKRLCLHSTKTTKILSSSLKKSCQQKNHKPSKATETSSSLQQSCRKKLNFNRNVNRVSLSLSLAPYPEPYLRLFEVINTAVENGRHKGLTNHWLAWEADKVSFPILLRPHILFLLASEKKRPLTTITTSAIQGSNFWANSKPTTVTKYETTNV